MTLARRPRLLLALLVASWAVSWPLIKVGVATMPPLWFACLRYAIAAPCLFAIAAARREAAWPPRADWPMVAVSAIFQMAAYSGMTAIALTILPPGRASVLAFSTPIWVVPLAAAWLGERMPPRGLLGTALGLGGALAIAAPALRFGGGAGAAAYALLLGAAASWAISIVAVRAHRFTAGTLALAPWQALLAAGLLLPAAIAFEGMPAPLAPAAIASLAFVGPVATAFAYWAVVEAGRHFSAGTLATALLATPPLGLLISAFTLGEAVDAPLAIGAAFIAAGIRLAAGAAPAGVTSSK